jgi:hypothetical protein
VPGERTSGNACSVCEIENDKQAKAHHFFAVDTRVSRCYKPLNDKFFGGESPNELQNAVRE